MPRVSKPKPAHVPRGPLGGRPTVQRYPADRAVSVTLAGGATVEYVPNVLSPTEAADLYAELVSDGTWAQGSYSMFGKKVATPRLLSCMRDDGVDVSKVYKVTPAYDWLPGVLAARRAVEAHFSGQLRFDYAQLNWYRDGNDHIGYHTDSEVHDGDLIAGLSLGAVRRFQLRHISHGKKRKAQKDEAEAVIDADNASGSEDEHPVVEFSMAPGSLLVMGGTCQRTWKHRVPKEPKVTEGRINVTFRNS
eukprot:TRINITY_DN1072_c0_g1_i1.p1 TRINITY_DN1072_c0_g1~~TRINITY_DN1072_c0_g1_i1.p1  ORF type:complete len:248 (+),score=24.51 TRINITY_DN1072_c0_g1_i1:36-779(+)